MRKKHVIRLLRKERMEFISESNRIYATDTTGKVIAEITFPETQSGVFTINHTFVDDSLRGQGVAAELVQRAVNQIRLQGGKIEATCSYAIHWLEKHEEI